MRRLIYSAILVLAAGSTAHAENVDDIIAKNLKARGGLDKLKSVQTLRMIGKMMVGPGMEAPFTMEFKRPKRMRMDFSFQGMTGTQALDGDSGWAIVPFTGKKDPERMAPDDLKEAQEQADFDGMLVDHKQKGHKVELVGKQKIEGTDAYKLKVTLKNGDVHYVYLDAEAFLEIKDEGKRFVRGNAVDFESTTSDYKEVNGVMFPFTFEFGAKGQGQKAKLTVTKIEVNPKIDDARFKMPASSPEKKPTSPPEDKPGAEKKPPAAPMPPPAKGK
jgi:outer membrane lipoprotein-sorting protein